MSRLSHYASLLTLAGALAAPAAAQIKAPGEEGSRNVHVYSHVPLGKPTPSATSRSSRNSAGPTRTSCAPSVMPDSTCST